MVNFFIVGSNFSVSLFGIPRVTTESVQLSLKLNALFAFLLIWTRSVELSWIEESYDSQLTNFLFMFCSYTTKVSLSLFRGGDFLNLSLFGRF